MPIENSRSKKVLFRSRRVCRESNPEKLDEMVIEKTRRACIQIRVKDSPYCMTIQKTWLCAVDLQSVSCYWWSMLGRAIILPKEHCIIVMDTNASITTPRLATLTTNAVMNDAITVGWAILKDS